MTSRRKRKKKKECNR